MEFFDELDLVVDNLKNDVQSDIRDNKIRVDDFYGYVEVTDKIKISAKNARDVVRALIDNEENSGGVLVENHKSGRRKKQVGESGYQMLQSFSSLFGENLFSSNSTKLLNFSEDSFEFEFSSFSLLLLPPALTSPNVPVRKNPTEKPTAKTNAEAGRMTIEETLTLEIANAQTRPKRNTKTFFLSSIPIETRKLRSALDSPGASELPRSSQPPYTVEDEEAHETETLNEENENMRGLVLRGHLELEA